MPSYTATVSTTAIGVDSVTSITTKLSGLTAQQILTSTTLNVTCATVFNPPALTSSVEYNHSISYIDPNDVYIMSPRSLFFGSIAVLPVTLVVAFTPPNVLAQSVISASGQINGNVYTGDVLTVVLDGFTLSSDPLHCNLTFDNALQSNAMFSFSESGFPANKLTISVPLPGTFLQPNSLLSHSYKIECVIVMPTGMPSPSDAVFSLVDYRTVVVATKTASFTPPVTPPALTVAVTPTSKVAGTSTGLTIAMHMDPLTPFTNGNVVAFTTTPISVLSQDPPGCGCYAVSQDVTLTATGQAWSIGVGSNAQNPLLDITVFCPCAMNPAAVGDTVTVKAAVSNIGTLPIS